MHGEASCLDKEGEEITTISKAGEGEVSAIQRKAVGIEDVTLNRG